MEREGKEGREDMGWVKWEGLRRRGIIMEAGKRREEFLPVHF